MFTLLHEWQMHRKSVLTFFLLFLLSFSVLSVTSLIATQADSGDINYSIRSTVTFANPYGGTKIWNLTEEDRTIGLFMNNSWQNVELKSTNLPFEVLKNDEDGNRIAVLKFPEQRLLPGENASYTIEHSIVSRPRSIPEMLESESGKLEAIPQDLRENYTRDEGPWMVKDPTLVQMAHYLAGNERKVLNIVKGLVGWITSNVDYATHELPLYPNETLSMGEGDCDDQAILLVSLARILGIPSYLQIGAIYVSGNRSVEETYWEGHVRTVQIRIGWHGWAMVYVPPWGWLPVDLTYVFSDSLDPLDAIRYGAITQQSTIQYINISRANYVAESRESRNFILKNGFYIDVKDEMTENEDNGLIGRPEITIGIVVGVATVMLLVSCLLIVRRQRRHPERLEVPAPPV